jgi:ribonuclease P protein component
MPEKRDESFSRKHRLSKSSDFKRIFAKGKRTATPLFVIYSLRNHLPYSRLGIQVRAKIGTAVRRNRIKRMVREVFRKVKNDALESLDLVFVAEKTLRDAKFNLFETEFHRVWKKLIR